MQPQTSLGGGGRLSWEDYSGLWAAKPCQAARRRAEGREGPSLSSSCSEGAPLIVWTVVPGIFLAAEDAQ